MTKYFAALTLCLVLNVVNAQQFKVDTLLYHDIPAERIDFVILGDGYLESQLDDFLDDARSMTDDLFGAYPFTQYKNYFNVFAISVPSNVEGAAKDPGQLIDNYFGSTFNSGGIQRLLVPTRFDRIDEVMVNNFPTYDQVLMVVNSVVYGGSGGSIATFSVHEEASEIAIHELGHSFGALADEYWAGDQFAWEAPNMTRETNPYLIRWRNWLNEAGIGIIPHGGSNWYKPHPNCKMQSLGAPFCAVCKEQIIWTIHDITSPIGPHETNVGDEVISFDLTLIEPDPNTFKIKWLLNDLEFDQNVTATEVRVEDLTSGTNTVTAIIWDSTTLDRRNTLQITSIRWTVQAGMPFSVQKNFEDRPGLVVTDVKEEISGMSLSVFPNPSSSKLIVEYDLPGPSQAEFSILDSEGKRVFSILKESQIHRNTQEIDISAFSTGLYVLKFRSGGFSQSLRIMKSD